MNGFAQQAYLYYLQMGYQPHQAAALAGNIQAESAGNPLAVGDGGKAFGLYQWHPDRQAGLQGFAKGQGLDRTDPYAQLAYSHNELQTSEKRAGDALRAATDVPSANDAMMAYLRPAGYTRGNPRAGHNYAGRLENAYALFDKGSAEGAPPSAMARMRGKDGGAAPEGSTPPPGLLERFTEAIGPDYLDKPADPKAGAKVGVDYGMKLVEQAQDQPEDMPVPQAQLYRPKKYQPITLRGLL
jgi:hypothetical protein